MENIKSFKKNGFELKIFVDPSVDNNPRNDLENIGVMLTEHPRHIFGGINDNPQKYTNDSSWKDDIEKYAEKYFEDKEIFYLPLYLYDHSGLGINWDKAYFYHDKWDTSNIGWYVFSIDKLVEIYPEYKDNDLNKNKEIAFEIAKQEISDYNDYIANFNTYYGYILEDPEGEIVSSVTGYLDVDSSDLSNLTIMNIFEDLHIPDFQLYFKTEEEYISWKESLYKLVLQK